MAAQITKRAAGLVTGAVAAGVLALGLGFAPTALALGPDLAPIASAPKGCGYSYHDAGSLCAGNAPGLGARPDPGNPNCWINDYGDQRC